VKGALRGPQYLFLPQTDLLNWPSTNSFENIWFGLIDGSVGDCGADGGRAGSSIGTRSADSIPSCAADIGGGY